MNASFIMESCFNKRIEKKTIEIEKFKSFTFTNKFKF